MNRIKRKSKRDNEGKPSSGDSKNSHFQETKSGLNGEIADIPKIVIQPSISDNEDDNDDIVKGKLLKVSKTPHKNIRIHSQHFQNSIWKFLSFEDTNRNEVLSDSKDDENNSVPNEQRKDNEEESGFEDEGDESNGGSSGDEGKWLQFTD